MDYVKLMETGGWVDLPIKGYSFNVINKNCRWTNKDGRKTPLLLARQGSEVGYNIFNRESEVTEFYSMDELMQMCKEEI